MELLWKLSGSEKQKGEGLLGLQESSGLIYIHRHTELWTLGCSSGLPPVIKGWLCSGSPQRPGGWRGAWLGWPSSVCCAHGYPQPRGYSTAPSPPLLSPDPGWHQAGSCRQLIPVQLSEGCGARTISASLTEKSRKPCPCHQQHSRNKQLRRTCSARLTSHAARQPLKLITVWATTKALLFILSIQHLFVFPCCFPSLMGHRERESAIQTKRMKKV